jgi:hypothetical protein
VTAAASGSRRVAMRRATRAFFTSAMQTSWPRVATRALPLGAC